MTMVSCVVCHVKGRESIFKFPDLKEFPDEWHLEYQGYLVGPSLIHSGHRNQAKLSAWMKPLKLYKEGWQTKMELCCTCWRPDVASYSALIMWRAGSSHVHTSRTQ